MPRKNIQDLKNLGLDNILNRKCYLTPEEYLVDFRHTKELSLQDGVIVSDNTSENFEESGLKLTGKITEVIPETT